MDFREAVVIIIEGGGGRIYFATVFGENTLGSSSTLKLLFLSWSKHFAKNLFTFSSS